MHPVGRWREWYHSRRHMALLTAAAEVATVEEQFLCISFGCFIGVLFGLHQSETLMI